MICISHLLFRKKWDCVVLDLRLFTVNPDFALVIESTTAADVAEVDTSHQVCNLSKGATVTVMDRATVYDKEMISAAFELAEKNNIAVQYKRAVAGGNDSVQFIRAEAE